MNWDPALQQDCVFPCPLSLPCLLERSWGSVFSVREGLRGAESLGRTEVLLETRRAVLLVFAGGTGAWKKVWK